MSNSMYLTNNDALTRLHRELLEILNKYRISKYNWRNYFIFLFEDHVISVFTWKSTLILLFMIVSLIIAYLLKPVKDTILLIEIVVISLCLIGNLCLAIFESRCSLFEFSDRAATLLDSLHKLANDSDWSVKDFLDVNCPLSPSVNLQWTIRIIDDKPQICNVPSSLLVSGDIILLRSSQIIPAKCQEVKCNDSESRTFHRGEIYITNHKDKNINNDEVLSEPTKRTFIKPHEAILLETPISFYFSNMLNLNNTRDMSVLTKECRNIIFVVETFILPLFFVLSLIIGVLHYLFNTNSDLIFLVLINPINVCIPMTALLFPMLWHFIGIIGVSRVLLKYNHVFDPTNTAHSLREQFLHFLSILKCSNQESLPRTANISHSLGNITNFCCVDKKGVLSSSNPTAEKIFFLREPTQDEKNDSINDELAPTGKYISNKNNRKKSNRNQDELNEPAVMEVLDLTYKNGYLKFDDNNWRKYMSSLKPFGLNTLLNTCDEKTISTYTSFADHVTFNCQNHEDTVPVVNHRCFCEVAKEIGFKKSAVSIFDLKNQAAMFRKIPSIKNEQATYKMPAPYLFSVISRHQISGLNQLFSQGSAPLLLDVCTDYWNGKSLCKLTEIEKSKITDFYHRSSLPSYCTAFGYRPLPARQIDCDINGFNLTELPPHIHDLYIRRERSSTMSLHSASEFNEETIDWDINSDKCSIDSFKAQSNQVFLGLITMQYQVKRDIITLVERLEKACIRFVHFSKENELRSRVFSEKMGLEAGWNCHISLASDVSTKVSTNHNIQDSSERRKSVMLHLKSQERRKSLSQNSRPSIDTDPLLTTMPPNQPVDVSNDSTLPSSTTNIENSECISMSSFPNFMNSSLESMAGFKNVAMLPRGVENIIPHIEAIDNVPLLVSLFTDCTHDTTSEMFRIFQVYGEIVCSFGSSYSIDNCLLFLKTACSISVDPIFPKVCMKKMDFNDLEDICNVTKTSKNSDSEIEEDSVIEDEEEEGGEEEGERDEEGDLISQICQNNDEIKDNLAVMNFARKFISLSTCLHFSHNSFLSISKLIITARAHCLIQRTTAQFYLNSQVILLFTMFLGQCLGSPALTADLLLILSLIVIPLLCCSLIAFKKFANIHKWAHGKSFTILSKMSIFRFVFQTLYRCLPISFCCILLQLFNRFLYCRTHYKCCCYVPILCSCEQLSSEVVELFFQHFVFCQLIIYLSISSLSFFNPNELLVNIKNLLPFTLILSFIVILMIFYTFILNYIYGFLHLEYFHYIIIIIAAIFPVIQISIYEYIKHINIKLSIRLQKKIRLEFGTKLGMNSPF